MPHSTTGNHLTLAVERLGEEAVVRCNGKLVAGVNDRLYLEVSQLLPGCKRIVLDFTHLTHMDSMGIGRWFACTFPPSRQAAFSNSTTLANRFGSCWALLICCRYLPSLAKTTSRWAETRAVGQ